MGLYRVTKEQAGGGDATSYTATVNGVPQLSSCAYMFNYNTSFNSPVVIGDNVRNCAYMFNSCFNFNSPVTLGNNVGYCYSMFRNANNFNQQLVIPDSVENCGYMMEGARRFKCDIYIGAGCKNVTFMMRNCMNFGNDIYIKSENFPSRAAVTAMLTNTNNSKTKNIHIRPSMNSIFNGTASTESLTSWASGISWSTMANGRGFYNATGNIYVYNDYTT